MFISVNKCIRAVMLFGPCGSHVYEVEGDATSKTARQVPVTPSVSPIWSLQVGEVGILVRDEPVGDTLP